MFSGYYQPQDSIASVIPCSPEMSIRTTIADGLTGSRADLFCYERTITSLQFFMNLIRIVLQNSGESCLSMNKGSFLCGQMYLGVHS